MTRRKKALLKAAELGDVGAVIRLLKKRFLFFPMNVNYTDDKGASPLIKATNRISLNQIFNTPWKNYKYDEEILEIAKLLLANGADVNANRKYGYIYRCTPLINYLKHSDNENIIMLLLEHGADVNIICEGGTTALCVAAAKRAKHLVDLLLDHGADVKIGNNPIIETNLEITDLLVSRGADVNSHPEKEDTALIWAVRDCDDARMEYLLSQGASVNEKGKGGNTPLFMAAVWSLKAVERLVLIGAAVNAINENGETPLMWTVQSKVKENRRDIVDFLLANGADVQIKNKSGETALEIARKNDFAPIVEAFTKKRP